MELLNAVSRTVLIPGIKWIMLAAMMNLSLASQCAQAFPTSFEPMLSQNSFKSRSVSAVNKPEFVEASIELKTSDRSYTGEKAVEQKSDDDETSLVFLPSGLDSTNSINVPSTSPRAKSSEKLVIPDNISAPVTIGQIPHPAFNQAKAISDVILSIASQKRKTGYKVKNVSVPSSLYLDVIMELQNRKASVMPPGESAPAKARVKFQLQSGNSDMKQFIFLK